MTERPNRRSIRLPDWDYRSPGFYFVTICTAARRAIFVDEQIIEVAENTWTYIPNQPHAHHVAVDAWVIMPTHMHGILDFTAELDDFDTYDSTRSGPLPGSLGAVIGNYKTLVTRRIKALKRAIGTDLKVWQRGYWERIIRNERELNATREYIHLNPLRWAEDRDNLDGLLLKMNFREGS